MTELLLGLCAVPYDPRSSVQPIPASASYRALRALGADGLRLQFDLSIASPAPSAWDTSLFRSWITPAFEAGMDVNANFCIGRVLAHLTAEFIELGAYLLAQEFGHMVKSWSFNNEPGADAQAYEGDAGPTAERDYMRDVYMPMCVAFVRGIRRAIPNAWILGCDADSAAIQRRYTTLADELLHPSFSNLPGGVEVPPMEPLNICDEEGIHNYGDVGGGSYARLVGTPDDPGFLDVRTTRPVGIEEIDHQQLPSAKQRERDVAAEWINAGRATEAALQGAIARLRPTPEETMALVELLRRVGREFRDCTRFMVNMPDHFFERGKAWNGAEVCSFYLPEPVVSDGGRAFAAAIAEINGPADPVRTTMPVRRRAVGK